VGRDTSVSQIFAGLEPPVARDDLEGLLVDYRPYNDRLKQPLFNYGGLQRFERTRVLPGRPLGVSDLANLKVFDKACKLSGLQNDRLWDVIRRWADLWSLAAYLACDITMF
jgi:hypothetical protein